MPKVLIAITDSAAESIVAVCGPQSITYFCTVAAHALAETLKEHGNFFDPDFADRISGAGAAKQLRITIAGADTNAPKPQRRSPAARTAKRRPNDNVPRRTRSPRSTTSRDGSSERDDRSNETGPVLPD